MKTKNTFPIAYLLTVSIIFILTSCPMAPAIIPTGADWELDLGDPCASSPVILPTGDLLVLTFHGKLFKVKNPGGASPSSTLIADLKDTCIFPPVVDDDGSVYIASGTGRVYKLNDFSDTPETIWTGRETAPRTMDQNVAVTGATAYLLFDRYLELLAYDKTSGAFKFRIDLRTFYEAGEFSSEFGWPGQFKMVPCDVEGYELVVTIDPDKFLFVKSDGTTITLDIGLPYAEPVVYPCDFRYTSSDTLIDTPYGPMVMGIDGITEASGMMSSSKTVLRKITPSWADIPADNMELEIPLGYVSDGYSYLTGMRPRLLDGIRIEFFSQGIAGSFFAVWNLSDGSLWQTYDFIFDQQLGGGSFLWFASLPVVFYESDGSQPWVYFINGRQGTSMMDKYLGRFPGETGSAIDTVISFPENPLVSDPVMVKGALVAAFADGKVRGWNMDSGAQLPVTMNVARRNETAR